MWTWSNVLINHLLLVIPVIPVSLYTFMSSYVTQTRTHTHALSVRIMCIYPVGVCVCVCPQELCVQAREQRQHSVTQRSEQLHQHHTAQLVSNHGNHNPPHHPAKHPIMSHGTVGSVGCLWADRVAMATSLCQSGGGHMSFQTHKTFVLKILLMKSERYLTLCRQQGN